MAEKTHIMLNDYNHLKKGERVVYVGDTRDSGYLVSIVHNGDGHTAKPLERDVESIERVKERLSIYTKQVYELMELLTSVENN